MRLDELVWVKRREGAKNVELREKERESGGKRNSKGGILMVEA